MTGLYHSCEYVMHTYEINRVMCICVYIYIYTRTIHLYVSISRKCLLYLDQANIRFIKSFCSLLMISKCLCMGFCFRTRLTFRVVWRNALGLLAPVSLLYTDQNLSQQGPEASLWAELGGSLTEDLSSLPNPLGFPSQNKRNVCRN